MVITILDATVDKEKWDELKAGFKKMTETVAPQIVQSLLVQNAQEPGAWRLMTIWKSREAFGEYRKSVQLPVPEGTALFRTVGAEAVPSLFTVSEYSKTNPA